MNESPFLRVSIVICYTYYWNKNTLKLILEEAWFLNKLRYRTMQRQGPFISCLLSEASKGNGFGCTGLMDC